MHNFPLDFCLEIENGVSHGLLYLNYCGDTLKPCWFWFKIYMHKLCYNISFNIFFVFKCFHKKIFLLYLNVCCS